MHVSDEPDELAERVRERLLDADYTVAGVRERLGAVAADALAREETVPALRATTGTDPLATLIRLWWLQVPVDEAAARAALPLDELAAAGLVERDGGDRVRAAVHVQPWETDAYVVSDRTARPGDAPPRPDHVVGAGGASASLAQLAVRTEVGSALDLGTGCGVQALGLAGRVGRAGSVCATDVNPRALRLARWSFALSGVPGVETARGSLFEPVADRRFDLIVSNPPFVIAPQARYTYREAGLTGGAGDEVCRELVEQAPRHLTEGGWCQLLASWLHVDGEDWRERLGDLVTDSGCDGWVVQRDVQDPAAYVETWLRDSVEQGTPHYREQYDQWLNFLERRGVTGVGYGWISLHHAGPARSVGPAVRVEELPHTVDQPVGGYVEQVFAGLTMAQRLSDEELLAACPRATPGLTQEHSGPAGFDQPKRIVLRQTDGLRRAVAAGTVEAALAGAGDGAVAMETLLAVIAELIDEDPDELREQAPQALRALIADGFFTLPDD